MARLIDADVLLNTETFAVSDGDCKECENEYRWAVMEAPTVDAVPVVRCRERKHFGGHGICFCHAADVDGTPIFVREDDFCSYGERKEK